MNIEFYENNEYKKIEFSKSNLFLFEIGGGKTKLANFLYEGLCDKCSRDFIANGVNVDKSMFDVTFVEDNFNFDDYLKFKVRGDMFKDFKTNILEDCSEEINSYLVSINEKISKYSFNSYYDKLNDSLSDSSVQLQSGIADIEDIYDELFSIIFNSEILSRSTKVEIVLKHMLLYRDPAKVNIFVIDDYLTSMSKDVIKSIISLIDKQDNIYVVFTSSYPIALTHFHSVMFSNYTKLPFNSLYQYLFLYSQWDQKGDFNTFIDSNLHLVEESDYKKYEKLIDDNELLLSQIDNYDEFIEQCIFHFFKKS